jgi:hypothetical protein
LAARLPPPATRERSAATRLITLLFYFCSLSRDSGRRVKTATRNTSSGSAGGLPFRSGSSRSP